MVHWIDDIHVLLAIIDFCHASTFQDETIDYFTKDFLIAEKFQFWRVLFRQYFPDGRLPKEVEVKLTLSLLQKRKFFTRTKEEFIYSLGGVYIFFRVQAAFW